MKEDRKVKTVQSRDGAATSNSTQYRDSKQGKRRHQHHRTPKVEPFQGNHDDLKGHVYTYDGLTRASQFRETTERIGEWAKQNCTTFPLDVWKSIESLVEPNQDSWRPSAPTNPNDVVDAAIFKEEVQEFTKRKRAYRDNCTKLFTVALGQCSQATNAKLEAREDWENMKSEHNLVHLLKAIKSLLHNQLQNDRHSGITAYDSLKTVFKVRQARHEETAEYRKRFSAATEVLEHVGITFGAMFQGMADNILKSQYDKDREGSTDEQATEAETKAGESVLAIMSLKQSCAVRYGEVTRELQNDFLKGKDNYPTDITAAYSMLANWRQWERKRDAAPPLDGVAYSMD